MRQELIDMLPTYETVIDCYKGEVAIKSKALKYIAKNQDMPNEMYLKKVKGATYIPVVDKKLDSDIGIITKNNTELTIKDREDIKEWIDSNGVDLSKTKLNEYKRRLAEELLTLGRVGVLIDFAVFEEARHLKQRQNSKNRAFSTIYTSQNIINWRSNMNGLEMVVLKENVEEKDPSNPFEVINIEQYRGLFIDDKKEYIQITTRKDSNGEWFVNSQVKPKIGGKALDFIPFKISNYDGSDINSVPKPPTTDLAILSIHALNNAADMDMLAHLFSIPTPVYKKGEPKNDYQTTPEDFDVDDDAHLNPETREIEYNNRESFNKPFVFGWSEINVMPERDTIEFLQLKSEGTAFLESIYDRKLDIMDKLGAKHLGRTQGNESFETAYMKRSADFAMLSSIARVITETIKWSVEIMVYWQFKAEVEVIYEVRTDFSKSQISDSQLNAMITLYQTGDLPFEDIYSLLKEVELVDSSKDSNEALEKAREDKMV